MKKFYNFLGAAILLLTLFSFPIGMRGQTTGEVALSSGSFNDNVITWTCAEGNITIQQLKGSGSTNPNSSYISAPRVYKQNILSFVGVNGYTITNIAIKCNGAYYGTTMYAGTEISNNNVDNNTSALNPTWTTANGGTHTIATASTNGLSEIYIQNGHSSDASNQLRITQLTITYMEGSGSIAATTVTINDDDLTNTDVYTSTTAGSLSAIVTETESGDTISGATVAWSSSDTNVATINASGVVTLVGTGTTTITASYAGVSGTYSTSSATYTLGVTSSEPYVQPTTIDIVPNYTFWGKEGQFSGSTYSELSGSQDNLTLDWTRGSGSTYANLTAMRFYKDNTLTFTAPTGYMITSIVITFSTAQSDLSFDPEGYALSGTTGTWEGSASTVTMTRPSNASSFAQITHFTITISLPSDVATPTFSPTSGTEFGDEGIDVTITCDTEDIYYIYYTLDGSEPDDTSDQYEGPIHLTTTTTVKAIAYDDSDNPSAVATATYTYVDPNAPGTVNNPYTVAQAIANTPSTGDVYIQGIVSSFYNTSIVGDGSNFRYYISDDGTTTTQLLVYKGKGLNQTTFSNADDLLVGDEVVICGSLIMYQNAPEVASGNYLYSWNRPAADVEAPTFNPVAGTYADTQTVTISCETPNVDIFYTLDGTVPTDESTPYNGAITVSQTTTIKAIAYANDEASAVATATYHINSQDNPYTVTEALAFNEYPANGIYVHGIVSTAPTSLSNGTLTYYISVDGENTNQLEVYKGKGLENANFTAVDDIQVGDIVTVYGNVVIYNNIKEFAQGNYLVEFERPAVQHEEYTLTVGDPAHITFTVNYGEEVLTNGENADIEEETEITLTVSVEEGYILNGITVVGEDSSQTVTVTSTSTVGVYTFTMPAFNATLNATVSEAPDATTYTLATTIESGKNYIIVGQSNGVYYAMGNDKGNNRYAYEITLNGTTAYASAATGSFVHEFTISSLATDGFYSICDAMEPGYLFAASSNSNYLKTEAELDANHNGEWEISIDAETGVASVVASNGSNTRNVMQFNHTNILFACYSSASQHPVYLYVKDETPAAETHTLTITGYGNNNQPSHYYLIASPVAVDLSNHALTTGDFDLYCFDQAQENEWQNWKDDTDGHFNLVPGMGYLYANKTGGDFELSGTAYEGDGTVTLVKNDNAPHFAGWNLVGNPFAEVAYIEDGRDFYVLTDGSEIIPFDGNEIQKMQGIFVIAETNNETMTFTTTNPANTGNKFVFNISQGRGDVIDRAMVRFGEGRTLPKFQLFENSTKLYIPQGEEDYAVVYAANNGELPLNFHAAENGSYTLSFDNQAGEFSSLHLIDNKTRADIDLLANPSYTFNAETTDDEGRFTLVYTKASPKTLTVCEGGNTNSNVPVYTLYADYGTRSQFIIPATLLGDMEGGIIQNITFYNNNTASINFDQGFTVYMMEVDYTTFASTTLVDWNSMTEVYQGNLVVSNNEMSIELLNPYLYGGSNLMIGIQITSWGTICPSSNWKGENQTGRTALYNNANSSHSWSSTVNGVSFIPQTTFTYEEGAQNDCETPATLVADPVLAHEATLTWTGGSGTYNVVYKKASESWDNATTAASGITTLTCNLRGLDPNTSYQARVYSVCGTETSNPKMVSFTTPIACPAPTALSVSLTPGNGSVATFSWTNGADERAWQLCIDGDETNLINMNSNPFTYERFTAEQTYTAKVRAYCDEIDQSEWSNTVTFTPTNAYMLTVNDGNNTNEFVPFYGYYADSGTNGQFIIPAANLEAMQFGTINQLTFYTNAAVSNSTLTSNSGVTAEFEVYMAITDNTTFSSTTLSWTDMTKVRNAASIEIVGQEMLIILDSPFDYMGGNLMIGFKETKNGGYAHTYWYGITAIGASVGGYGSSYSNRNFLPKTTFSYTPGEEPTCYKPTNLNYSNVAAHEATIDWTNGNEETAWEICLNGDEDNLIEAREHHYTLTGLNSSTTYTVKVRANCGSEDGTSEWSNEITFTTEIACPAPTSLTVDSKTPTSATFSWNNTDARSYNLRYREIEGGTKATIILTAHDVWGDGSGYQMVLDADATAYSTLYDSNNGWLVSDWSEFEYLIPANADFDVASTNVVFDGSVSIQIPAGTYDYFITNPSEGVMYIAGSGGNVPGRYDNYVFEAGKTYEFTATMIGSGDGINLTVTGGEKAGKSKANDWIVVENVTSPYTLDRLTSEQWYEVQVQAVCGGEDGESVWSESIEVELPSACDTPLNLNADALHTEATVSWEGYQDSYNVQWRTAATQEVILEESFENGIGRWTVQNSSNSNVGQITSNVANNGAHSFAFTSWTDASAYDQYLISPELTSIGTLKFYYSTYGQYGPESFEVGYSSTNNIDDFTWGSTVSSSTTSWETYEEEIPRGTKYFAIHYTSNYCAYLYVDDIFVLGQDIPAGEWTTAEKVTSPYTFSDLRSNTEYDWRVQGVCKDNTTEWAEGSFTTLSDNQKVFITDGAWSDATNWEGGIPTASDNAIMKAAAYIPANYVAVANTITIDGGSITVKDGGRLQNLNSNVTVTMEKEITGYTSTKDHYYLISSSVVGTINAASVPNLINEVEDNYDLYSFNGASEGTEWVNYKAHGFDIQNGRGYLYANKDDVTLSFTGTVYSTSGKQYYAQGSNTYLTYNTSTSFGTMNLVGNIFACDAELSLYYGGSIVPVEDYYKIVEGESGSKVMLTDDVTLAPNEAAFIEATGSYQNAIIAAVTENGDKANRSMLNISVLSGNEKLDMARVRFDESHNLTKFQLRENQTKLYFPQDDKEFAVVNSEAQGEMPVNFKAEKNGTYTLNFAGKNTEFTYLHLIDNLTGNDVDLLQNPNYSFDARYTDYAQRFKLVYATGNTADSDTFGFISNDHLMILGLDGQATLKVMDVTGRTLSTETFSGSYDKALNLSSGVYMLQLIQGSNVKTQKIVVD